MMTSIGEVMEGTLLKRVKTDKSPCMTEGKTYEVTGIDHYGVWVQNDHGNEWNVHLDLYEIVGHVDGGIIEELDQILEFCLQYDKLNDYIVKRG